uniref:Calmodulin-lysine N-methyltransferase n=1 Tax=Minutocellus polymorphus TaxID=265543 RepID=A0A7S0AYW1_9STRA
MEEEQHEHLDEPLGIADAMMRRGDHLRMLRMMAEQDEAERVAVQSNVSSGTSDCSPALEQDEYETLPTSGGSKLLHYDSYLRHQRYHDDLKHVDYHYIDYGDCGGSQQAGGRLVIRQQKDLGKGGICWDAAFILAEHLIACEEEWKKVDPNNDSDCNATQTTLCELGAGTGLAGFMIAKACRDSRVFVTDLPELLDLMKANFDLNFVNCKCGGASSEAGVEEDFSILRQKFGEDLFRSEGIAEAKVLRWGVKSDYEGAPFDVVFGADVVASLYDPIALANTFSDLCGPQSLIYLSYKGRLDGPHLLFEAELKRLFRVVERIVHPNIHSRNKNPGVCILKAWGKNG